MLYKVCGVCKGRGTVGVYGPGANSTTTFEPCTAGCTRIYVKPADEPTPTEASS